MKGGCFCHHFHFSKTNRLNPVSLYSKTLLTRANEKSRGSHVNQCEPLSLIHKTLISNFSLQISLPFFSSQRKYELHFLLSFRGTSYRAIGESYPSVLRYESDSIFLGNQSVLTLSVTSNLIFSLAGRRCFWAMIVATIFASAPSQSARHVSHNPFSIEALPPCRE